MTVCRFNIHVCHQVTIGQVNVDILKVDVFFIRLKHKLCTITKSIWLFHETFKFLFTMIPYKECTIYIPKPNKMLKFLHFKKVILIHKNACIRWCKFCANRGSRNLMKYILLKLKVVISENFCHFYDHIRYLDLVIITRYLLVLPKIQCVFKNLRNRPVLCGILGYKPEFT